MFGIQGFRLVTLVCALALIGCAGGDGEATTSSEDEHSGGEHHHDAHHHDAHHGAGHHGARHHGDHHGDAPAAIVAFHDVLAPAWHSEPGETRQAAACAAVEELATRATALETAPEENTGSSEDWSQAAGALGSSVGDLREACSAAPPDDVEGQLSIVHDAFHALTELLPGHGH